MIWINTAYPQVAQRLTIAHELGHMLLQQEGIHLGLPANSNERLAQRTEVDPIELQAEQFAAELLMPKFMLLCDLKEAPMKSEDDEMLKTLAARYGVSLHAIAIRLSELNLI